MKKLTVEEFQDRAQAILRARKIFISSGVTKNISVAFELYQEMLAEQERVLRLTHERNRDYGILANLQRPICPDCGKELGLRLINTPKGNANIHGYNSSWACDDECCHEEFSTNTLQDWLKELKQKEAV